MMTTIGYYNYYHIHNRYETDSPIDRYQQQVDRYNSDELHANNEDPYTERALSERDFDEKMADVYASVRTMCSTEEDVQQYFRNKYFGSPQIPYTYKWERPEEYAMMENDINGVLFGSVGKNLKDPRLNYTLTEFNTYEANQKASAQKAISNQMHRLLENNDIFLHEGDSFLISIDPYSYEANVEGSEDVDLLQKIVKALNSGDNAKELFFYSMNQSSLDTLSLAKFRAYHEVKKYTGLDLSQLTVKDGQYFTKDHQNLLDLMAKRIQDSSTPPEFKDAAFENIKNKIDMVLKNGYDLIKDLDIKIGYSLKNGFFAIRQSHKA